MIIYNDRVHQALHGRYETDIDKHNRIHSFTRDQRFAPDILSLAHRFLNFYDIHLICCTPYQTVILDMCETVLKI